MINRKISLLLIGFSLLIGCGKNTVPISGTSSTSTSSSSKPQPLPAGLAGYEAMPIPPDNPMTPEKVALGKQLFFDERLSIDGTRSCYSCHSCEHGLSDGLHKAVGADNMPQTRNTPTLWNIGYHTQFYWDGRSDSLEQQALAEWKGGNMGVGERTSEIVAKINALQDYRSQFQKVFQSDATAENMMKAIAAFERTIIGGNTAFDRWRAGDQSAMSEAAVRGWNIFQGIKCNNCHDGLLFTDQQFHNIGIGMDQTPVDVGRYEVSKNMQDYGAFKTPTLRGIARSAPYFHDGSANTLEEAVDIMLGGGKPNEFLDKKNLQPRHPLPDQREALLDFLRALTVDCTLSKPALPQR